MLIFDIGCNCGDWIAENMALYPDAQFIGVDANTDLCERADRRNPDAIILNVLVSDKSNLMIPFYIEETNTDSLNSTASTFWIHEGRFAGRGKWREPIRVKSITLDDLIKIYGEPHHIKIDVEGYELEVMKGLTHKSGGISFEWVIEQKDKIMECLEYLHGLGYVHFNWSLFNNFNWSAQKDYPYRPAEFYSYEQFRQIIGSLTPDYKNGKIFISPESFSWGMIYAE